VRNGGVAAAAWLESGVARKHRNGGIKRDMKAKRMLANIISI